MSAPRLKGPWVARQYGGSLDDSWYVRGPNDQAICGQGSGPVRGDVARLIAAAPELLDALIGAKQEMWLSARHQWTMSDFKNWAIIQKIDAVLEKADGKPRTEAAIAKATGAA